jgi:hypothetical protein
MEDTMEVTMEVTTEVIMEDTMGTIIIKLFYHISCWLKILSVSCG